MSKWQEHRKLLWEFLWLVWDAVEWTAKTVWTLWANAIIWAWKWVVDLADMAWDAAAYVPDLLFDTDFWDREWFLDKAWKAVDSWAKALWDKVRKNIGPDWMQWQAWELITDITREAWTFISPWIAVKWASLIPKIAKFVPWINALNEAEKAKFINEAVQMKKAWILTKESLQALWNKYSPSVIKWVQEQWAWRRAEYLLWEAKNLLKDIKPNDIRLFAEKYPKLWKILLSPQNLNEWIKANPKKALTVLWTISSWKVAYNRYDDWSWNESMLPPQNIWSNEETKWEKEETVDDIENSITDTDTNKVTNWPIKSSQDISSHLKWPSLENKDVKWWDTASPDNSEWKDPQLSKYKEGTIWANVERQMDEWSKLNLKESVSDTMRAVGIENWFQWRQRLFEQLFKEPYRGTAEQNIKLREKIKDYSAEDIIDMMKQWYTMTM